MLIDAQIKVQSGSLLSKRTFLNKQNSNNKFDQKVEYNCKYQFGKYINNPEE